MNGNNKTHMTSAAKDALHQFKMETAREVGVDGSGFIARISTRFSGDFLVLLRDGWESVLKNGDPTPRPDVLDEARRQIANVFGGVR